MKRFIFSVCALAAVVVGCTKSEVINRPHAEEPIQFNPYTGRIPVTKGTAADIDTLGKYGFQVYAFIHESGGTANYQGKPYMNKIVTKDSTGAWTYSGNAYWPGKNQLDFVAYGRNALERITPNASVYNEINFSVSDTVSTHKDLLVALVQLNKTYTEDNQGTVDLVFSHLLSRIGFSLITKDGNPTPVTIEKLDLEGNFYDSGKVVLSKFTDKRDTLYRPDSTYKVANRPYIERTADTQAAKKTTYSLLPTIDGNVASYTDKGSSKGTHIYDNSLLYTKYTGDESTYDDDKYDAITNPSDSVKAQVAFNMQNRYMMIIPVAGNTHGAKLKVKYFLPGAEAFDEVTVDLAGVDFEPGKSYDFKLKVSTQGISFQVDVEPWDTREEDRQSIVLR